MDVYEALYTTRAMRRVRPDPIPLTVQARILDAAIRARRAATLRTGGSCWPTTPTSSGRSAPSTAMPSTSSGRRSTPTGWPPPRRNPDDDESVEMLKVQRSAQWLADHFEQVPLFLFGFVLADPPEVRSSRRSGVHNWRPEPRESGVH